MKKIIKKHDIRKNEFLDVAQELFSSKGYEKTTISNILDQIQVARGTFYHYFKSKEELLDSLLTRQADILVKMFQKVISQTDLNAIDKLNAIFSIIQTQIMEAKNLFITRSIAIYRDENLILRHKIQVRRMEIGKPIFLEIITQGINEGLFDIPHPEQAAEFFMLIIGNNSDTRARLAIDADKTPENIKRAGKYAEMSRLTLERMLQVPQGSFHALRIEKGQKL